MQRFEARLACFIGSAIFFASAGLADPPPLSDAEKARVEYVQKALQGEASPVPGRRMVGSGTGFFVAPKRVLTNFHVIERCTVLTIRGNDGKTVAATLVAGDKQHDLALISIEATSTAIATFRPTENTRAGEAVATVGYPTLGMPRIEPLLTAGTIAADGRPEGPPRFAIQADIRPGNSGGPVLDEYGQVVGVVTAKINTVQVYERTGQNIQKVGYAIATGPVLEFLRRTGVEATRAEAPPKLGTGKELLDNASKFTARVGCWQ